MLAIVDMRRCFWNFCADGAELWVTIILPVLMISIPELVAKFHDGYSVRPWYSLYGLMISIPIHHLKGGSCPVVILFQLCLQLLAVFKIMDFGFYVSGKDCVEVDQCDDL